MNALTDLLKHTKDDKLIFLVLSMIAAIHDYKKIYNKHKTTDFIKQHRVYVTICQKRQAAFEALSEVLCQLLQYCEEHNVTTNWADPIINKYEYAVNEWVMNMNTP